MVSTTHPEFGATTEAMEVARAFADQVRGKTVLITGVSRKGLGFTTAQAFASQAAARLILAGRDPAKLRECADALRADYPAVDYRALRVDLSSQASVRAAAAEALAWADVPALDILVNNAAAMMLPERTLSVDGVEMHFATNHLGHFLLTNLLMPKLLAAAARPGVPRGAVRVVNVAAMLRGPVKLRWSDTNFDKVNKTLPPDEQPFYPLHSFWGEQGTEDKAYVAIEGYYQTKIANVLFGVAVTDRLYAFHGVRSLALHPGVIETELGRNHSDAAKAAIQKMADNGMIAFKTQAAGAATTLVAALDPKLGEGVGVGAEGAGAGTAAAHKTENYGAYLVDCQIMGDVSVNAVSSFEAAKLWEKSEEMVGEKFSW